jgi:hypothetical protein
MKVWERILLTLSAVFASASLMGELFWPAHLRFIVDDLFFPFGLIFLGYIFVNKKEWRWFIGVFVLLSAWGLLSDLLANQTLRIQPIGMLARWLKWPIICLTVAQFSALNITKRKVEHGIVLVFLSLVGVNFVMLLNPFGLGEALSEFYGANPLLILANYNEFGAFRLSGTFANPNNNAAVFALFLVFFLHVDARKYWKYILLAFVLIFLTQSRTTLIISVLILGIYVVRIIPMRRTLWIIPLGMLTLFGGIFFFRSRALLSIFDGSAFQSNSWMQRMEHYEVFHDATSRELFAGHGVILDPITQVGFYFDSEYLSIFYQYGIIGGVCWLSALFLLGRITAGKNRFTGLAGSILLLVLGVSITNFTFLNVEFATLLAFLCGGWMLLQATDKFDYNSKEETQ